MKKLALHFFYFLGPLSLIADCSYDKNGNISTLFIPDNGEVKYTYDPINRLTDTYYPDGKFFHYSYDYNSNITAIDGSQGRTRYFYGLLDRLERAVFPDGSEVSYQYDCMGRLIALTYPDGEEVTYRYDPKGYLVEVKEEGGITRYEYDDLTHLVTKEILPNGIITSYKYDETSQVLEVLHQDRQDRLILHYKYEYDKQGNCIFIRESTTELTKDMWCEYDLLDRLIRVEDDQGYFEKYTYDELGNRLSKSTSSETICYKYDAHNRLIQAGDTFYSYDIVGNLTKKRSAKGETTYSYDPTGKLASYFDGSNRVTFEYDGHGNRISKTVNGKSTYFINDPIAPLSRVLMEKDEQGEWKKYIYGNSRVIQKGNLESEYFLYNHPGKSVSCLVDENGNQTHFSYDSFGSSKHPSMMTSYGFNGEEVDPETGLIYLRNRYYDPEIGRFISPDFILGSLYHPQTLNPYVFVLNNPLTFVDPTGLQAIKVPLRIYANPPGAHPRNRKSLAGHAWTGGVDEQNHFFTLGAYPGNVVRADEISRSFCDETVHMTLWVTPEQLHQAQTPYKVGLWGLHLNCVDYVSKALDAVGYPHPEFKLPDEGAVSLPTFLYNWIKEERNHIHPNFLPQEGDVLIGESILNASGGLLGRETHSSYIDLHFCRPNYGGVLLDKCAEFFTELDDISGVIYDEQMGQMILYGRENLALPHMDMDDLAVAVRSIYGLGKKGPESPGVSMEPGYKNQKKQTGGCMVISYFGETENTRFGQVMFEADRVLKNLSMGKDNVTGKPIKSSVPGYKDLQLRRAKEGCPPSSTCCRLWFVPQKITLSESQDGTSMVFSEASMEVLTESTLRKKGVVEDRAAEKFAHHFTQYYDSFSQEYPVLNELKRLGKITAIVKWIKEKRLPFDLTPFEIYMPYYVGTPKYSPITAYMGERQYVIGGVAYTLSEENYLVQKNAQVDQIKEDILKERPSDEALSWNFGRGMVAIAKNVGKSLKVGEVHKTFVDLSYSLGHIPLSFVRTYSSFNEISFPLGRGWEIVPARMHFNQGLTSFSFSDGMTLNLYPQVIVRLEGVESVYTLSGLNKEREPIYKKEGSTFYILQNTQGVFTWHRQNETLVFSPKGHLTHLLDFNGKGLQYHYDNEDLTEISHSSGEVITLEYVDSQLYCVSGPGGKTLYYEYDPQGRLQAVRDTEGAFTSYAYDKGSRLTAILNSKDHTIFAAKYDEHHRAIEQMIGENFTTQAFNLRDRSVSFEGGSNFYEHYFDPEYRPKLIQDALGREVEFTYGKDKGPEKIITSTGLEVEYEYDSEGRLVKVVDEYEGERFFSYNSQGKVTHEIDGKGVASFYRYDPLGRLIQVYRPFQLLSYELNNQTFLDGNSNYLTTFEYDEGSGLLKSIRFPDSRTETYCYNSQGLPIQIKLSNGTTIIREYDARHRLVQVKAQGKTIRYEYDNRDRITKITSQESSNQFNYDISGNIISRTDALHRISRYDYNSHEKLISAIDSQGQSTTYEYDSSRLCKMYLPNGSTREIFYDEYSRPVAMR